MKITFIGATHEVTGSCYYLEAAGKKFLVDCGMEQGPDYYENQEIPVKGSDLDFVLLTHAHMDHSGNLPAIYAKGFQGPVYATQATCHLCDIMLRDSAHIQMFEAEWRNRKGRRQGKPEFIPAYTMEDALGVLQNFVPCPYEKTITPAEGIRVRFVDAGHLLGSASIEVIINEDGKEKKIVFSGDIGNLNQPLIKDPVYLHDADYVVMESTYGDRSHGDRPDYVGLLSEVIQRTFDRGGSVIIPSFAVGRTQEMLYFIRQIKEEGRVHGHDNFKVYVDSPLANEATTIFNEHIYDCFDEEAMALVNKGINPLMFPGLKTSITSDDSKAINFDEDCKVIISASGMCDAGRIKHHLKHNLWNPNNTILFVGYQAIGTLGRSLLEGATEVKLFGETVYVGAEICQMPGISGHADVNGLMTWIKSFNQKPAKVFVTHGDDEVTEIFARRLEEELGLDAMAPFSGTVFDLAENVCIYEAQGIKITKTAVSPKTSKAARAFQKLVAMGQRLMSVIRKSEGIPNKDLDRFTREVQSLCDKWDRDDLS
ncbi:MBL fold metallo-hydrolase [Ruminococcus sp. AF17-22AC]|uniref:MBL fold metallo-hydrolase RNA specificity domain-containing protein n=1 Tax=Clostridia TaxID=186801 RepID=UPI000E47337A|nr:MULTISPECIES: MBL fold metallo-hydrolase [Clostridia]MCB6544466.1 MBL fold metallo-hydrolase [Blautia glucerasea]RGU32342.1 MBL fold metallo-hydrolase [Ruminococcus sp. AF17-22AC]RHO77588.1 MBL fold metallo-hydrolase [Ruminococcus sp. AF45-4BH]